MSTTDLDPVQTARELVAEGKGILAADESSPTMDKRLAPVLDHAPTVEDRRTFRELLFTTAGAAEHISGVILYDETLRQSAADGTPFGDMLHAQGLLPGIKVDTGAKPLAGSPDEKVTEGLDGLRERLVEYRELGARFAKWRAVIEIAADGRPTEACIEANAHALARYAALCQEAGLVPIVEPEVLMDGEHTIDRSEAVTEHVLAHVFAELRSQHVALDAMLLKPNMVLSAYDCPDQADVAEVAQRTVATLRRAVPAAVAGIAFLSGGQDDEHASAHLDAMNRLGPEPWQLTFSYGRALQATPLSIWGGKDSSAQEAQAAYLAAAQRNGAAREGRYSGDASQLQPAS